MAGAYGALSNATTAWTTALAGTGVMIVPTQVDCSGSSNCIVVQTDSALAPCGYANPTIIDPQTGVISAGTIAVRTDWYSRYSSEGLERTFVHELGHFLGLQNYDKRPKCPIDDAAERGSHCLLLLKQENDVYRLAGTFFGAFSIADSKLFPLVTKQGCAHELRGTDAASAEHAILERARAIAGEQ